MVTGDEPFMAFRRSPHVPDTEPTFSNDIEYNWTSIGEHIVSFALVHALIAARAIPDP